MAIVADDAKAIQEMFETLSLGAPEETPSAFVLWRIVAGYQREMDRALAPLDLTNLQFVTLALAAWFGRSGESANQAELAALGASIPCKSRTCSRRWKARVLSRANAAFPIIGPS